MDVQGPTMPSRRFSFVAEYSSEKHLNSKYYILKEEGDTEYPGNNYLYQVTPASRVNV